MIVPLHYTRFLVLSVLLLPVLLGCGSRETTVPPEQHVVVDALGREVVLPDPVSRIAPLAPSVTEIAWLLGGAGVLAGVTTADDFPPGVHDMPSYNALPVDFETIVSLRPDLVVATSQVNAPRDADTFSTLGIPVYFFEHRSIQDVMESVTTLGQMMDRDERAAEIVDSLRQRIQALQRQTVKAQDRPSAVFLISARTSWSFGPESHVHDLMDWAGFDSITRDFPSEAPVLSDEFIINAAPDFIFGTFGEEDPIESLLSHHPAWRNVPAIRNRRAFSIEADFALRPGPRAIEAAWQMARHRPEGVRE